MQENRAGHINVINQLSLLWSKVAPKWAHKKIDSQLFLHNTQNEKIKQHPRGITQKNLKTPEGNVNLYSIGSGPAVVFVHGWGGRSSQFFPLMRGLDKCGFTAIAFDHLGHGTSESKPATVQQMIISTNYVLNHVKKTHRDGFYGVVAHGLGCMITVNVRTGTINNKPLFLISPIFNFKLYFLRKLSTLKLHPDILKKYAAEFIKNYDEEFAPMELGNRLERYDDYTVLAHDQNDNISPLKDSEKFVNTHPLTKLSITRTLDHDRIITSESVWQELKSHLNYEDITINFSNIVVDEQSFNPQ